MRTQLPNTPTNVIRHLALAAVALTAVATSSQANVVADFSGGEGTTNPSTQFVGTTGEGWISEWGTSTENTVMTPTVTDVNPISGSDNYLSVNIDGGASASRRSSLYRGYDPTAISSTYTINFTLRFDDLTGWGSSDFIGIFSAQNAQVSSTSTSAQTWGIFITASNGISLRNGESGVNTGLSLVEDTTYTYSITVDSVARTWEANISSTEGDFTSGTLGFRTATDTGRYIMFNTLMSSDSDNWTYSIDGISVIPEASSAAYLSLAFVLLLPALRRRAQARK